MVLEGAQAFSVHIQNTQYGECEVMGQVLFTSHIEKSTETKKSQHPYCLPFPTL